MMHTNICIPCWIPASIAMYGGQLLDSMVAAPGEMPSMNIKQVFHAHGQTSGEAMDHMVNMHSYYDHLYEDNHLL